MPNGATLPHSQHPAPLRGNVSTVALFAGLLASPLAWGLQLVINYGLAAHACYPGDMPLHDVAPGFHSTRTIILLINLLAMALALAGAAPVLSALARDAGGAARRS